MLHNPSYTDNAVVHTLSNGMTVTLENLPYLHSVSIGLWVKTGSANERAEEAGISHFLEHLFFKGTTTRTARELMETIESTGGHLNAFTSREYTCVYVKMLDTHVDIGLEILADILRNSQFYELEKERQVVLEEIASVEDVPEEYVHDLFAERLWPGHPLGRAVTGTLESLPRIGLPEVRAYYDRWYQPHNVLLSVAGNFDELAVLERVRAAFDDLPAGPTHARGPAPTLGAGIEYIERDIGQHHICFGFPGPTVNDPRRYVYDMMSNALGGGSVSRLFDRIREKEGLVYSIYTFHSSYFTSGMFGVYAAATPENLARTLELSFEELRRFRDEPMNEAELAMNREQLKGGMLMALESTFNRMMRMAKSIIYHGRIIPLDEVLDAVNAITAEEMRQLAADTFDPKQCNLVVLGPEGGPRITEVAL